MSPPLTAEIALPIPLRTCFHYAIPEALDAQAQPGMRVLVPFGPRKMTGYLVRRNTEPPSQIALQPIIGILDSEPTFTPQILSFCLWLADYYCAAPGEVLRGAHPAGNDPIFIPAVRRTAQALAPTAPEWLKNWPKEGSPIALTALKPYAKEIPHAIESGWLERCHITKTKVEPKTALSYRAIAPLPLRKRPLKCDEIHRWLIEHGVSQLTEIKQVFKNCAPHIKRLLEEHLIAEEEIEIERNPFFAAKIERDRPPQLNAAQQKAVDQISSAQGYCGFLLHGVTGSGKTEVYLHVIEKALARGQSALVLVPEIALTPQLVRRFRARLGDQIAVLHSGLTPGERLDQWRRCRQGLVQVAIGARSSIFAPLRNLGLIIVDEEHDPSFKQAEGVRYQGRDMALVRGQRENAVVILGSATPSLESAHNARIGKLTRISLTERPTGGRLPRIEMIDLRCHQPPQDRAALLSLPLRHAISETLARGEQAILFLNRRGFSNVVICPSCGQVLECNSCSISYTWHQRSQLLRCHYCDACRPLPDHCPHCGHPGFEMPGQGTERVEEALSWLWPNARIARLDRDTAQTARHLEDILRRMNQGEIDLLIGTQMVTKGHDFHRVTLVGVLSADISLSFPDFRSSERTFQLLTQVAGRAGRGQLPGRVFIQTYNPDHPCLQAIRDQNYAQFAQNELQLRQLRGYPPSSYAAVLRIEGHQSDAVEKLAKEIAKRLRNHIASTDPIILRGPTLAPIGLLRGKTRFMMLITSPQRSALRKLLSTMDPALFQRSEPHVILDIDPYDFL